MLKILLAAAALAIFGAGLLVAANAATGSWEVVSTPEGGDEVIWKMVIKEDAGKLTGTLSGEEGDFTLEDVKLEGEILSFKVTIDEQTYTVEARLSDSKFQGVFKSTRVSGTVRGTKQ
jgi:hypothetical protein